VGILAVVERVGTGELASDFHVGALDNSRVCSSNNGGLVSEWKKAFLVVLLGSFGSEFHRLF
jgi:hypothetical protein